MAIVVIGINHKSPLALREKVSLNTNQTAHVMQALVDKDGVTECVIVSTCNRTEFYMVVKNQDVIFAIREWLTEEFVIEERELQRYFYMYADLQAIQHLLEVATGLDSAVIGETQILGQVKASYALAHSQGTTRKTFNKLFQGTIRFAKSVHTKYKINDHSLSTNYLVGQYIKHEIPSYTKCSLLVIGAGENSQLFIQIAQGLGIQNITVTNRNMERGNEVAKTYGVRQVDFSQLSKVINEFSIVFTSTASEEFILSAATIRGAFTEIHRPVKMTIFDCAVPRDVEPSVGELEGIRLVNLDMLTKMKTENENIRLRLREQILQEIYLYAREFQLWLAENLKNSYNRKASLHRVM